MPAPTLWIATTNQAKSSEYQALLPQFTIKTIQNLPQNYVEPLENGLSFAENAMIKAQHLAQKTQHLALGDDSGVCVAELKGFPGIYSRRWAAPETDWKKICQQLLDKLQQSSNPENRQATMVTALALFDPQTQQSQIFLGEVKGTLAHQVKTGAGFGYDFIFCPGDETRTYSEMGQVEKNKFSSRQLAAQQLKTYLESKRKND